MGGVRLSDSQEQHDLGHAALIEHCVRKLPIGDVMKQLPP